MSAQKDGIFGQVRDYPDDTLPDSTVKRIGAFLEPRRSREKAEEFFAHGRIYCKHFNRLGCQRQLEVVAYCFLMWAASTQRTNRLGQHAQEIIKLWEEKNL